MTLDDAKRKAIQTLEAEARRQAHDDRRVYMEGISFLYLIGVLLSVSDAELIGEAQREAQTTGPVLDPENWRKNAENITEDVRMVEALATCRRALLDMMPALAGQVATAAKSAPRFVRAEEPFDQICNAVGPHGLVYLATLHAAARIARNSTIVSGGPTDLVAGAVPTH